ncbi:hypothetical protein ABIA33_006372 [Streptacidiphilus sp. MAP12-16]|uniref:hypothetical protein n=1 Tax=Streptacidiphilus sp. MAP12-16 TaxID=3156300 RepID=UPI003511F9E5
MDGFLAVGGLLFHTATITEAGLRIVDLWNSSGALDAFMSRMLPALKEAGFPEVGPPKTTEVYYYYPQR